MTLAFYIAAIIAVISSVLIVTGRNAVHSLLYLVVSLLSVAVIFFTLGAPLIAALEVIVYAGAIIVLFIFVVMMLNKGRESIEEESTLLLPNVWRGPAVLTGILALEVIGMILGKGMGTSAAHTVEPKDLSLVLFGPYALAVELASILLLAGLVGAYHLGRRERPVDRNKSSEKESRN
jgi:NADH-quinone oxidoreductase subunit J